jgi:3'-phosphoadenosine 5'-phosphosulfate sulfotransferase (PAPS reductase)/FAD synthetase
MPTRREPELRAFAYGGGVHSTAALVLAAAGRIDFPVFLFANVGDDSEHPATLRYVRDLAARTPPRRHRVARASPWRHDGTVETL